MEKIKWKKAKGGRVMEHLLEGYVDNKLAFIIEGRLCVTDHRASKKSLEANGEWEHPKHYKLDYSQPREDIRNEAKTIASDLLNGINTEKHQANWQAGEDEAAATAKTIKDAEDFLTSLTKNK
jgi:hypothetical protein